MQEVKGNSVESHGDSLQCRNTTYSSIHYTAKSLKSNEISTTHDDFRKRFKCESFNKIKESELEYYLEEWLPIQKCATNMIASAGGVGKTMLALQIAIRMILENK